MRFFSILVAALSLFSSLQADTLDWSTVNWNNTSTFNQTFNVGGTNVTVNLAKTSGVTWLTSLDSPGDNNTLVGNGSFGSQSLLLAVNNADDDDYVTVTVTFSRPVNNVSFRLFDVDRYDISSSDNADFTDLISNIRGLNGSSTYYATLSNIGAGANNAISGSGTASAQAVGIGDAESPANSNDGNVLISFGTNAVTSFSFRYGNDKATLDTTNPGNQGIGLGNINFAVAVPETSGVLAALLLSGFIFRRNRRRAAIAI